MTRNFAIACHLLLACGVLFGAAEDEQYWPQWRGPLATGVAPGAEPPIEWSETRNVRWKVAIVGQGSASPVVWGDTVFVLTAVPAGAGKAASEPGVQRFVVLAIDRHDGHVIWERTVTTEQPHEGQLEGWASSSAVTDGEIICAFFGSRGVHCYDMDGTPQWTRDFGDLAIIAAVGEGSSPALHGDSLFVLWDHEGQSFITALDKATGEERWRTKRDEATSWATPLVVEHGGRTQVVTSGTGRVRSYDAETGRLLWDGDGVAANAIPSPVAAGGLVYLMSGYQGSRLYAVDLATAHGDITDTDAIVWSLDRDTPRVPSPVLYDGVLYFTKSNSGVLSAYDAASGRKLYGPQRLPGIHDVFASPVAAAGRLYVTSRDGTTLVVEAGPEPSVLATNRLDDDFVASPAVVGRELYLRGRQTLYCIAAE